jgi:hypothetical protein
MLEFAGASIVNLLYGDSSEYDGTILGHPVLYMFTVSLG